MSFEQEKNDLLNSLEPLTENTNLEPKRGSKDDLISKIHECCDKHDIICEYSTTEEKARRNLSRGDRTVHGEEDP